MLANHGSRRAHRRALGVALLLNVSLLSVQDLIIVRVIDVYVGNLHLPRNFVLVKFLHLSQLCLQYIDTLLPVIIVSKLFYASLRDFLALATMSEKCRVRHIYGTYLLLEVIVLKLLNVLFQAPNSLFVVSLSQLIDTQLFCLKVLYPSLHTVYLCIIRSP